MGFLRRLNAEHECHLNNASNQNCGYSYSSTGGLTSRHQVMVRQPFENEHRSGEDAEFLQFDFFCDFYSDQSNEDCIENDADLDRYLDTDLDNSKDGVRATKAATRASMEEATARATRMTSAMKSSLMIVMMSILSRRSRRLARAIRSLPLLRSTRIMATVAFGMFGSLRASQTFLHTRQQSNSNCSYCLNLYYPL